MNHASFDRAFDQKAQRLARATAELTPSPGFTDAVLVAVELAAVELAAALALEPGVWAVVPRLGRRVALGFAAAALVAVGCAAAEAGSVDRALASNFNQVELEW
jgi:hypothetical protein